MNRCEKKYLLIIVETRKGAQTDDAYIRETIRRFYVETYDFTTRFIYMETKGAYNSQRVNREIKEYLRHSNVIGIILCIDTDDYDTSIDDANLNAKIKNQCKKKGYELVWFCKNIEDVYYFNVGVERNKKVIKAKQFIQKRMIENLEEKYLRSEKFSRRHSNILTVLDKYYKNR